MLDQPIANQIFKLRAFNAERNITVTKDIIVNVCAPLKVKQNMLSMQYEAYTIFEISR